MLATDAESAVYMVMHRATTRVYVGMTSRSVRGRWKEHVDSARRARPLKAMLPTAIAKYGPEAFDVFVLESDIAPDRLKDRERHYIKALRANVRGAGFNLTEGGDSAPSSDPRVRGKISAAQMGRRLTPEWKAKLSAALKGYKRTAAEVERSAMKRRGRTVSDETRERLRASHIGKPHSDETRARMAAAHAARTITAVEHARRSEAAKARWADPEHRARRMAALQSAADRRSESGEARAAVARRVLTPELREKFSLASKKRWAKVKGY